MGLVCLIAVSWGGFEAEVLSLAPVSTGVGNGLVQPPKRRKKGSAVVLVEAELSRRAGVSRATPDALENVRTGELGCSKVTRLLTTPGLELKLQTAKLNRPTVDDVLQGDAEIKVRADAAEVRLMDWNGERGSTFAPGEQARW
jgi:hypothetical protein